MSVTETECPGWATRTMNLKILNFFPSGFSSLSILGMTPCSLELHLGLVRPERLHNVDVENFDIYLGLLLVRPHILNFMNDIESLGGPAKDCMLPVQPWLRKVNLV